MTSLGESWTRPALEKEHATYTMLLKEAEKEKRVASEGRLVKDAVAGPLDGEAKFLAAMIV